MPVASRAAAQFESTVSAALDHGALAAALRETAQHMRDAAWPGAAAPQGDRRARRTHVAVLLPCHNEEATIAAVVAGFRAALPGARICVFDNASADATVERARAAGADVFFENRKGKGNVVRRMFADIDADIYLMADGDGTLTRPPPRA